MGDVISELGPDGARRTETERRVLSAILAAGSVSSAGIARDTGLSAQSASVLTRALESAGLLRRGAPQKGKVGKPQVPISLNPEGAFAFGLKIGRRQSDLVLLDFVGGVRGHLSVSHAYPTPEATTAFLREGIATLTGRMDPQHRARLTGIGIAAPFELWNWLDVVGAPKNEMLAWQGFSFPDAVAAFSDLTVTVANDATLACVAEQVFGLGRGLSDFAYFYIGSFIGGGLVLDGRIWTGPTGNAAAFGSIPVGDVNSAKHQLLHSASIFDLEQRLAAAGLRSGNIRETVETSPQIEAIIDQWLDTSATSIAVAAISVVAVLDLDTIVVDVALPGTIAQRLAAKTTTAFASIDRQGVRTPTVLAGRMGRSAGAIGAAYLPIAARYLSTGQNLSAPPIPAIAPETT